jgi:hypothetical protein
MSNTVKRGKLAKRKWKDGDPVFVSYAKNALGYWWAETEDALCGHPDIDIRQFRHGGLFATEAEAGRDSEIKLFGPQCQIKYGGQWDPAWDRPQ